MKRLRQRASAFLMAMIVLAVLTVVGLSLSMVTETEMRLGETEKVINEQFFANEAGSTVQVATLLATNGLEGVNVVIPSIAQSRSKNSPLNTGYDVVGSGLAPVTTDELPYTKVNEGRGDKLFAFYYHMKTLARRTAWNRSSGEDEDTVTTTPTCDDITDHELGRLLTQTGFYYAPAGELPDTALITMSELDNKGASQMDGVITTGSSCFTTGAVFTKVGGADGATF
jgi:hypothetical protein